MPVMFSARRVLLSAVHERMSVVFEGMSVGRGVLAAASPSSWDVSA